MGLSRLKIGHRLLLLVGIGGTALVLLAGIFIAGERDRMVADRLDKVRAVVEVGIGLAEVMDAQVRDGTLTRGQAEAFLQRSFESMWFDGTEYLFAWTRNGVSVAHGALPQLVGQRRWDLQDGQGNYIVRDLVAAAQSSPDGGTSTYHWPRNGSDVPVEKITYAIMFQPWDMFIAAGVYVDDVDAAVAGAAWRLFGVTGLLVLMTSVTALLISRSVTRPLTVLTGLTSRLAKGDHQFDVPFTDLNNELGGLGRALAVSKANAVEIENLAQQREADKAKAEADRKADLVALADRFEAQVGGVVDGVADAAGEVSTTAGALQRTAGTTQSQSVEVRNRAGEASSNVQTVAAATEELNASIEEIGRSMGEAADISTAAVSEAQETTERVNGLAAAAEKIGEVVGLITSIAEQTNLLALNATIEAARAGEAGKGFAVVAAEVKNLANQTGQATEEISQQINGIQDATGGTVEAISKITQTITRVSELATTVSSAVEQQGSATREIARNVQEAARGTEGVTETISAVAVSAEQTGEDAHRMAHAAQRLDSQAADLRGKVADFLEAVRAA